MTDELINSIMSQVEKLFIELGLEKMFINGESIYVHKGSCYKFSFITGLKGFVIETAESFQQAQKNVYEDSDVYLVSLGERKIIDKLRHDLNKYYLSNK